MPLRRTLSREFKLEAAKLVVERGVAVAQACRDLDLAESVLRRWMRELARAPASAFPGHGRVRCEQVEIPALAGEAARPGAERDMPQRRPRPSLRGKRDEVRLCRGAGTVASAGIGGVIAAARRSAKAAPSPEHAAGHSSALLVPDDARVRGLIDAVGLRIEQLNALGTDVRASSEATRPAPAAIQQARVAIRDMTREPIRNQRG